MQCVAEARFLDPRMSGAPTPPVKKLSEIRKTGEVFEISQVSTTCDDVSTILDRLKAAEAANQKLASRLEHLREKEVPEVTALEDRAKALLSKLEAQAEDAQIREAKAKEQEMTLRFAQSTPCCTPRDYASPQESTTPETTSGSTPHTGSSSALTPRQSPQKTLSTPRETRISLQQQLADASAAPEDGHGHRQGRVREMISSFENLQSVHVVSTHVQSNPKIEKADIERPNSLCQMEHAPDTCDENEKCKLKTEHFSIGTFKSEPDTVCSEKDDEGSFEVVREDAEGSFDVVREDAETRETASDEISKAHDVPKCIWGGKLWLKRTRTFVMRYAMLLPPEAPAYFVYGASHDEALLTAQGAYGNAAPERVVNLSQYTLTSQGIVQGSYRLHLVPFDPSRPQYTLRFELETDCERWFYAIRSAGASTLSDIL